MLTFADIRITKVIAFYRTIVIRWRCRLLD